MPNDERLSESDFRAFIEETRAEVDARLTSTSRARASRHACRQHPLTEARRTRR